MMKLRQVRTDEVKVLGAYIVGPWNVVVLSQLHRDADGNNYADAHPNASPVRGWWVVRGPCGPMRVRTRDLRLEVK